MTPHEETQLVSMIEHAVKSGVTPEASARPGTCSVCEVEIAIGAPVVELPVTASKVCTVCGDCFEVFTILPSPRPME